MISELLSGYLSSYENIAIIAVAWLAAVFALLQWKKTGRAFWIYLHIALLITPLVDFGTSIQCAMSFPSGLMTFCSDYIAKLSLLTLPFVLIASVIIGFFVIPAAYAARCKARRITPVSVKKAAKKAGILVPEVYVFDSQKPKAFTIHKNIFASVGLFDLLSLKEQEAVFLHEIGHIVSGSNWRKFSCTILKMFSPLAAFTPCHASNEEKEADAFAARLQRTTRFLNSAKRKFREYYGL